MKFINFLHIDFRSIFSLCGAAVTAFVAPTLPYVGICTAMVAADFISARMLARRIRRRSNAARNQSLKFSSARFGHTLMCLARVYALLLLAHGVDTVLLASGSGPCVLRFAAGLVCFWQFWSILENEASANDAPWARLAQKILIDKTSRHLGVDLSDLQNHNRATKD